MINTMITCNWRPSSGFFFSLAGAVSSSDSGNSERDEEAERERLEAIAEAEERRKEKHRKMEEERERMRQDIREKVRPRSHHCCHTSLMMRTRRNDAAPSRRYISHMNGTFPPAPLDYGHDDRPFPLSFYCGNLQPPLSSFRQYNKIGHDCIKSMKILLVRFRCKFLKSKMCDIWS
jgi:complexin-1/2